MKRNAEIAHSALRTAKPHASTSKAIAWTTLAASFVATVLKAASSGHCIIRQELVELVILEILVILALPKILTKT